MINLVQKSDKVDRCVQSTNQPQVIQIKSDHISGRSHPGFFLTYYFAYVKFFSAQFSSSSFYFFFFKFKKKFDTILWWEQVSKRKQVLKNVQGMTLKEHHPFIILQDLV